MLNTNYRPETTASSSNLTTLVDEFATLHQAVKSYEPTIQRYEQLKKQLASEANAFGSGEVRLSGSVGYVTFTKPATKRKLIDIPGFLRAVGIQKFLDCVTVSVTKADKLLSESQKAAMFKSEPGARRLKDAGLVGDLVASAATSGARTRH